MDNAFFHRKIKDFLLIWGANFGIGMKCNVCSVLKDGYLVKIINVLLLRILANLLIIKVNVKSVIEVLI